MSRSSSALTAALLALGLAAPASATIMVPLSLEDLTGDAAAIVRARVVESSAAWDEGRQKIWTTTVLDVSETVWSAAPVGRQVRVRTLGGEVGDMGMKVAGTPVLKLGEEVLLFLRADSKVAGAFAVIGMNQGRFSMRTDTAGRLIATPTWEGIAFAKPGQDGVLRVGDRHETPREQPYLDLRAKILALKARPATTPAVPAPPAAPRAPATAPATAPAGK